MNKVLIIGNGAREHVIADTLMRSNRTPELFVFGGAKNPELEKLTSGYEVGDVTDLDAIKAFAKSIQPDVAIPGPEGPIAVGVVDMLDEMNIPSIAPHKTTARLESSKSFTRNLLRKYNIPGNPKFKVFTQEAGLEIYMINELEGEFVVKADGLKGGKGVKVVGDHLANVAEGAAYARECIIDSGHVVIEEKFVGEEFSLMSFVDGETVTDMIPVQDHKRAYENDEGPNTGGMGSYGDANHLLPFLTEKDIQDAHDITVQVAKAIHEETGIPFRGIMFGGFIAVKDGVRLIEYNARFGDPEAMNCLPLLKTDFMDICEAMVRRELKGMPIEFEKKASVCKYVVPNGYPDKPVKGEKIIVSDIPSNVRAFYGSVDQKEDGLYLSGSRAIAFVGIGDSLDEAEQAAQNAVSSVKGPVFYRSDIGTAELLQKRIDMMKSLRG
jgi:phosphoribosylamine---glycine ligase